jgi:hypothetical protein
MYSGAVGKPGVGHRACCIHARSGLPEESIYERAQVVVIIESDLCALELTCPFHPHFCGAVYQDVGNLPVSHQVAQGTEPIHDIGDARQVGQIGRRSASDQRTQSKAAFGGLKFGDPIVAEDEVQ